MPFALIAIAVLLIIVAVEGTQDQLLTQLEKDFNGQNSFLVWIAAIIIVGSIGYIPALRTPARAFLVLIILGIVLANGKNGGATGFFRRFNEAIGAVGLNSDSIPVEAEV